MSFRKAIIKDFEAIMRIINSGRQWMNSKGPEQWTATYPNEEIISRDLTKGDSYVYEIEDKVVGTFSLSAGPDQYYDRLVEGQWLYKGLNYGVTSRMAIDTNQKGKGLGKIIIDQFEKIARTRKFDSVRGGTYEQNSQVKKLLLSAGYTHCGKFQGVGKVHALGFQKLLLSKSL